MLTVEHFETYGWESAIRGMRNPMNSWAKSDSNFTGFDGHMAFPLAVPEIGPNDFDLMKRLLAGGSDDRKYLRQIFVSCDITAPLYWWKEMDQYKVSTTTNSCSTMHKITAKGFVLDDFSHEHLTGPYMECLYTTIEYLNKARNAYINCDPEDKKSIWWQMIQLLPSSYNQRRTWTANYEVLVNIYHARRNHKLDEWHTFCNAIEQLPYSELITGKFQEQSSDVVIEDVGTKLTSSVLKKESNRPEFEQANIFGEFVAEKEIKKK